jgi:hypothetical protein
MGARRPQQLPRHPQVHDQIEIAVAALAPHHDRLPSPLHGGHTRAFQRRHIPALATVHIARREDRAGNDRTGKLLAQLTDDRFDFG